MNVLACIPYELSEPKFAAVTYEQKSAILALLNEGCNFDK